VPGLEPAVRDRFHSLHRLIGNTPLLAVDVRYRGEPRRIYAKHESLNLTGSIKDRMALFVLEQAYLHGHIRPGDRIAEATSGNTGISFAALGRALGHPVTIFMPDWMSEERRALIASFGAEIVLVSRGEGGFLGSIERAEEMAGAGDPHVFLPRQFSNEANVRAHSTTTGPEIWLQLPAAGRRARRVRGRRRHGRARSWAWDATSIVRTRRSGSIRSSRPSRRRSRPGTRSATTASRASPTSSSRRSSSSDELDPVISVHDGDAILMAQALAQHGLAVGISSGANFIGALHGAGRTGAAPWWSRSSATATRST
jgi:cysteine synthase